jgi:hypothetical protein
MAKALITSPFKNSPAFAGLPPSLNSFDARNAVNRHLSIPVFREVEVTQELVAFCARYCNCSINVLLSFLNPLRRESRKFVIIVCIVPCVQTCLVVRPHFSGYVRRLVAVIRPCLLISKDFVIFVRALCIDFAVVHRLFAQCCQSRVVVRESSAACPLGCKPLLVAVFYSYHRQTDDKAVFGCCIVYHLLAACGQAVCCCIAQCLPGCRVCLACLHNLIYIDWDALSADVLRNL